MGQENGPLVQIVLTKTQGGKIRLVEFSPTKVIDTKQFPQPEVALLIIRKLLDKLTAVGGFDV